MIVHLLSKYNIKARVFPGQSPLNQLTKIGDRAAGIPPSGEIEKYYLTSRAFRNPVTTQSASLT